MYQNKYHLIHYFKKLVFEIITCLQLLCTPLFHTRLSSIDHVILKSAKRLGNLR